jgi:hypothetical protein
LGQWKEKREEERAISVGLTKTAGRVGGIWREGEILEGAIERDINGRSIWAAGESELRGVMILGWFILGL